MTDGAGQTVDHRLLVFVDMTVYVFNAVGMPMRMQFVFIHGACLLSSDTL
jgi:hypothetical protein